MPQPRKKCFIIYNQWIIGNHTKMSIVLFKIHDITFRQLIISIYSATLFDNFIMIGLFVWENDLCQ